MSTLPQLERAITAYFPDADLDQVRVAYDFADKAHTGQKRSSGEPYITHPTDVARTLAEMRLDIHSIITGLLHDTVEDTPVSLEDIEEKFGDDVSTLVDGVTKLSKITFRTREEKQAENFRKMIIAMAKDIRVILVKLADRLHNMKTLEHLPQIKQQNIAQETLDIYAPISNRLGISWMKTELEDLCLRYLHPDIYQKLREKVSKTKKEREKYIEEVVEILNEKMKEYDITAEVQGRAKHFFSIYKKMEHRKVDFEQVYDIIAFRIVTDNITECYKALGVIHAIYKPVPGRFKDYISLPKANNYQSLHTTVIGPYGERLEIQIRTREMHDVAESGIAAHWRYKEGRLGQSNSPDGNVEWVNRLVEWQKDLSDPNEFLETVKIDLFAEDVFVFTPKGEVRQLPHGATPIDFAYAIHTDVGHRCIGAKVNGKIVPLKYRLKSGDTAAIITSNTQSPSKDWLKIARTSRAKAKIRAFIKLQERERAKELGREILDRMLKDWNRNYNKMERSGNILKWSKELKLKTVDELLTALGYGRLLSDDVVKVAIPAKEQEERAEESEEDKAAKADENFISRVFKSAAKKSGGRNAIQVANLDDVLIRFAKCCNPVPGDSIVGFITRGRGVTVHAANCPKALDMDAERKVDVRWNLHEKGGFRGSAKIRVLSLDEPGLLATMSQTMSGNGVNITSANIRTTKDKKAIALFDVEVSNVDQLQRITALLEGLKGVISVSRTRS